MYFRNQGIDKWIEEESDYLSSSAFLKRMAKLKRKLFTALDDACFITWEIEEAKILLTLSTATSECTFSVMFFRALGKEQKEKFYFSIAFCNGRFSVSAFLNARTENLQLHNASITWINLSWDYPSSQSSIKLQEASTTITQPYIPYHTLC